jgi:hypothetical protein
LLRHTGALFARDVGHRQLRLERGQLIVLLLHRPHDRLPPIAGGPQGTISGFLEKAARSERERRKHQKHREQVQSHRRGELDTLAVDVAAGQAARVQHQLGQREPDLAFQMQESVQQVVGQREEAAMQVNPVPTI